MLSDLFRDAQEDAEYKWCFCPAHFAEFTGRAISLYLSGTRTACLVTEKNRCSFVVEI